MDIFTVSLFGHREMNHLWALENRLIPKIRELIQTTPFVAFWVGRNGAFDEYAASIIKSVQKEQDRKNSDLTLVLPYMVADVEYYQKYYDSVVIPDCLRGVYPKSAITLRNRWMIEQSDLVIIYIERNKGGAYQALKHAEKMGKNTVIITA